MREVYWTPARCKGATMTIRPIWSSLTKLFTDLRSRTLQQCAPENVILYTIIYRCPLLLCKRQDYKTASVDIYIYMYMCVSVSIYIIKCIVISVYLWCILYIVAAEIYWQKIIKLTTISWGGGGFFRELYTSSRPPAPDATSSGGATKVGTSQFKSNCVFVYIPTFYMFVFMVTSSQCAVDLWTRKYKRGRGFHLSHGDVVLLLL